VGIHGDRDKTQGLGEHFTTLNHGSYLHLRPVENKAQNRMNENMKNGDQSDCNEK